MQFFHISYSMVSFHVLNLSLISHVHQLFKLWLLAKEYITDSNFCKLGFSTDLMFSIKEITVN